MNVFREIRRINNRSALSKFRIILLLYILLITSVYAWYATSKNVEVGNLGGKVDSWDVIYKFDDELLEEDITFTISDFYPGKSYNKVIYIYNMGLNPSHLQVELLDVKLFGESKKIYLNSVNGINFPYTENTANMFNTSEYPFEINYILNKSYIYTQYSEDNPVSTPNAVATLSFNFDWDYEVMNNPGVDNTTTIRDFSDTTLGNAVYDYMSNENVTEEQKQNILEVKLKITGERYYGEIPEE